MLLVAKTHKTLSPKKINRWCIVHSDAIAMTITGLIFFFVLVVIIIAIIQENKNRKAGKSSPRQNKYSNLSKPSPFNKSGEGLDLAAEIKGTNTNYNTPKNNTTSRETTRENRSVISSQMSQPNPSHSHPSAKGNIKIERVYTEESMGKSLSQGCQEHYYERYLSIKEPVVGEQVNQDLARIIVLGEIFNNPSFKKYRR